jgi:hypothetical protein
MIIFTFRITAPLFLKMQMDNYAISSVITKSSNTLFDIPIESINTGNHHDDIQIVQYIKELNQQKQLINEFLIERLVDPYTINTLTTLNEIIKWDTNITLKNYLELKEAMSNENIPITYRQFIEQLEGYVNSDYPSIRNLLGEYNGNKQS